MSTVKNTNGESPATLPAPLLAMLRQVIRRRRMVLATRGLLMVIAVSISVLLAVMAIDASVVLLSPVSRWLVTGAAAGCVVMAILWYLVRPLARPVSLARIARIVDAHHPEFEERVSSTVELLLESNGQAVGHTSPLLLRELTSQALDQVRAVQPRREFSLRSARPYLIAASGAGALLGMLWLIWPQETTRLMQRAIVPSLDLGTVGVDQLVVTPGDAMVALGDPLRIEVTFADSQADRGRVICTDAAADEKTYEMTRLTDEGDGSARFAATIARVDCAFRYRVLLDRTKLSRYYQVDVTPRPAVARYAVRYDFPSYTGLSAVTEENPPLDIVAPAGTLVTLAADLNKPVASARLHLDDQAVESEHLGESGGQSSAAWQFEVEPARTSKWSMELTDEHGLNVRTAEHSIRAILDSPPLVKIAEPELSEIRLKPTDVLPIVYLAREDYGISAAKLIVDVSPERSESFATGLPQASSVEQGTWVGRGALDLRTMALDGVPRIEVRVEVHDNRPDDLQGPQVARSKPIAIVFDVHARSYAQQSAEQIANALAARLNEAMQQLRGAKGQLASVLPTLETQPLQLDDRSQNATVAARNALGSAESILLELVETHAQSEYAGTTDQLDGIVIGYVNPSRQIMELLPLADSKAAQTADALSAEGKIDSAITNLESLIALFAAQRDPAARARELAAEAGSLADRQARIRDATETAVNPPDPESATESIARQIAEAQAQIAAETRELAQRTEAAGYRDSNEHQQATTSTRQAANELFAGNHEPAAAAGEQAADQLGQLSEQLAEKFEEPASNDPLAPPLAEQAADLARRQENVNEQLAALREGNLAEALASLQKDLAEQAERLAERTEKLRELAEQGGSPQQSEDAKGAGSDLGEAAEKAQEAAMQLAHIDNIPKKSPLKLIEGPQSPSDSGGNPDGGQGTKGGGSNTGAGSSKGPSPSNNNENKTMGAGKRLGKATLTAEALLNQKPSNDHRPSGGSGTELQADAEELLRKGLATLMADNNPFAKGFGGMGGAAPDVPVPDSPPKEFAAQSSPQANDQQGPPSGAQGGQPGGRNPAQGGARLGAGQGNVAARLAEMGISGDDWLRLPSALRTEILDAADERAPQEYRELVRRYFQTMARRANQPDESQ